MFIGDEGIRYSTLAHQDKTDGIAERISFIGTFEEKFDRAGVYVFVNPDDFGFFVINCSPDEGQRFITR